MSTSTSTPTILVICDRCRSVGNSEVLFDLTTGSLGFDAHEVLAELRRGDIHSRDIVSTPFSDWLDMSRRKWWAEEGEPERPRHPDVRFLKRQRTVEGDCSTYEDDSSTGATTTPARGFTQAQWAEMPSEDQRAARQAQYDEDAEEQREWEARARAEFEASTSSSPT